jgi:hypothetical protein
MVDWLKDCVSTVVVRFSGLPACGSLENLPPDVFLRDSSNCLRELRKHPNQQSGFVIRHLPAFLRVIVIVATWAFTSAGNQLE